MNRQARELLREIAFSSDAAIRPADRLPAAMRLLEDDEETIEDYWRRRALGRRR